MQLQDLEDDNASVSSYSSYSSYSSTATANASALVYPSNVQAISSSPAREQALSTNLSILSMDDADEKSENTRSVEVKPLPSPPRMPITGSPVITINSHSEKATELAFNMPLNSYNTPIGANYSQSERKTSIPQNPSTVPTEVTYRRDKSTAAVKRAKKKVAATMYVFGHRVPVEEAAESPTPPKIRSVVRAVNYVSPQRAGGFKQPRISPQRSTEKSLAPTQSPAPPPPAIPSSSLTTVQENEHEETAQQIGAGKEETKTSAAKRNKEAIKVNNSVKTPIKTESSNAPRLRRGRTDQNILNSANSSAEKGLKKDTTQSSRVTKSTKASPSPLRGNADSLQSTPASYDHVNAKVNSNNIPRSAEMGATPAAKNEGGSVQRSPGAEMGATPAAKEEGLLPQD